MRFSVVFLFFVIQMVVAQKYSGNQFYVYEGNDIPLTQLVDQLAVSFKPEMVENEQVHLLHEILGIQFEHAKERIFQDSRIVKLRTVWSSSDLEILAIKLMDQQELQSINPVFRQPGSRVRFTVDQSCIVKFIQPLNPEQSDIFKEKYSLTSITPIAEQTYRVVTSDRNGIMLANILSEDPQILWAQPNFIYLNWGILHSTVSDPLWPQQWAHVNTGQTVTSGAGYDGFPASVNGYSDADMDVDLAWDFLALNGSQAGGNTSVLVAMLDSGVDLDHPDIQDNLYSTGQDFTSDGQTDANDTQGHGTCTAGIVAAVANNGQGVAGIAYNSKILPVRIMNVWGVTSTANLVQAIDYAWQQGADILSNSWGGTTAEMALTEAIIRAKTQGRSGLGCAIFFSSGNEGRGIVNYPAYLNDVIAVGASNMFDEKKHSGAMDYNRTWSSNFGPTLDLLAPTIVYAPDIQGSAGYSTGDYFDHFGGTSAACPNAAGVAALVLSANSNLSADAVQDIMESTADKIERYPYDASGWNQHIGFGRVNALGAVRAAQAGDGSAPSLVHQIPQSGRSVVNRLITVEISDAGTVAIAQLFYRTVYALDTSAWQSISDTDGPLGNLYEFEIPGQKWGSQVQYYFYVQDGSIQSNSQTYPFGGSITQAPPRPWMYHVGVLNTLNYQQSSSVSWDNNWKDYKTSTLNIVDDNRIVDLDLNLNFNGNLNEASIDLSAADDLGAGLVMRYEGYALAGTKLDDEAQFDISQGVDPFSGSFRADNGLFNFDGKGSAGDWKIGVYDGDYTGSNSGSIDNWSLDITFMLPNEPPVVSDIPDQSISEGGSFSQIPLDDYVSDADHPLDSLTWSYSGNQDLTVSISANNLVTIHIPDENWYGAEIITFTCSDPGAHADSDSVNFTIIGLNDPPTVSAIPDQTINEGQNFELLQLDDYVSDIDHADAEITWTVSGSSELNLSINQNRQATIDIPDTNWNGSETLKFKASDPGNLADSCEVIFTVLALNDVPIITSIPLTTVYQDSLYTYQVKAMDVDSGAVLSYHLIAAPSFLGIDSVNGLIRGTPFKEDVGSHLVIVQVKDQMQAMVKQEYTLFVDNENSPPQIIEPLPLIHFAEDDSVDFVFESWYPFVEDIDNPDETLEYRVHNNHSKLSSSLLADGYRFKADENWFGTDSMLLKVSDGWLADSAGFVVQVHPRNDPPQIRNLPDSLFLFNSDSDSLMLSEYQLDIDTADSLLSWNFEVSDTSLDYTYDEEKRILVLSASGYIGLVQLYMVLTDDSSAFDYDSLCIVVKQETGIDEQNNYIPAALILYQNYPNPFNPNTIIEYQLSNPGKVTLTVYNNLGQKVQTLVSKEHEAGKYQVMFRTRNLSSGIYLYVLKQETATLSRRLMRKMLFIK